MKIDFKKLKEQSWKKTLAQLIIAGTLIVFGLVLTSLALALIYVICHVLWEAYSTSPSGFHWLFGVLGVIGTWMWAWDWADKQ